MAPYTNTSEISTSAFNSAFNFNATLYDAAGFSVVVLAATNRLSSIDLSLRRPGRFDREIEVGVPSPAERGQILRKMLRNIAHSLSDSQACLLHDSSAF
jgi:ATP-dependent Zn protease